MQSDHASSAASDSASWDSVWINAHLATMEPLENNPLGLFRDGAVAVKDGRIAWLGPMSDLSQQPGFSSAKVEDVKGKWLTPGLIDCHTHLVHAGHRAKEFAEYLSGKTYSEITAAGGGILSTVAATRAASEDALLEQTAPRLESWMREGVTTLEIKSGYGLDTAHELKLLRTIRRLAEWRKIRIQSTLLAAHLLPPEFSGDRDGYIDHICEELLPAAAEAGLVDAVDGFCETIGFTAMQLRRLFETARRLKLPVKVHAGQLPDQEGAELAAEFGALSADHLTYVKEGAVKAMAEAGTTAVLLPVTYYFMQQTEKPPVELFREYGVDMAVATNANPGTAPVESLLLALNMASICFGLTHVESLLGVTRHGAKALGLDKHIGTLAVGKAADFAIWNIMDMTELVYRIGANPCSGRVYGGQRTDSVFTG
jgi:imidazolonepropionase